MQAEAAAAAAAAEGCQVPYSVLTMHDNNDDTDAALRLHSQTKMLTMGDGKVGITQLPSSCNEIQNDNEAAHWKQKENDHSTLLLGQDEYFGATLLDLFGRA